MPEKTTRPRLNANSTSPLIHPPNGQIENPHDFHRRFLALAQIEPLSVVVGSNWGELIEPGHRDGLLEKITALRRQIAFELGVVVPGIRFARLDALPADGYAILLWGVEVSHGSLRSAKLLAVPGDPSMQLDGEAVIEPVYGTPAFWIEKSARKDAEKKGAGVYEPASVVAIHLAEVIRRNAAHLLGRQEVQYLIDHLAQEKPDLVAAVTPQPLTLGEIRAVLQSLVRERVSIRNLSSIFEALADVASFSRVPHQVLDGVRLALAPQIRRQHADATNAINAVTLSPALEKSLGEAATQALNAAPFSNVNTTPPLDPMMAARLVAALTQAIEGARRNGVPAVLVVHPAIRFFLVRLLSGMAPHLPVLSWAEVGAVTIPGATLRVIGTLQMEPAGEQPQK